MEIGGVFPSFNGADRSTVRGVKRTFGALSTYVDTTTKDSIISLLKWGRQIPCSGDLLGNLITLCTMRYTGARMVQDPGRWEVGLTGNEVQPNNLLSRYVPGDAITGEVFTRSTTAYQVGFGGTLNVAPINVKRDGHYVSGVLTLLLEGTRTNNLLWSNDFSNAAWVKTTCTIATGIADPAGGIAACTLTASGANATVSQTLATGASLARTFSPWLRRRTGVGTVQVLDGNGGGYTTVALSAAWARFPVTGAASINRQGAIKIVTNGDAIDAWMGDDEDGPFATSEITTTSTALARGADTYSLPFTQPPIEMTGYVKFVEKGTIQTTGGVVCYIGAATNLNPQFAVYATGGFYHVYHHNGTSSVDQALAIAPVIGDTVELAWRFYWDGSVDLTQSINGAASTSTAQSAANAPANAWAGQLCYLNSIGTTGTGVGFIALQNWRVVSGVRSLSDMRNS